MSPAMKVALFLAVWCALSVLVAWLWCRWRAANKASWDGEWE
jgi:hypothetical protein